MDTFASRARSIPVSHPRPALKPPPSGPRQPSAPIYSGIRLAQHLGIRCPKSFGLIGLRARNTLGTCPLRLTTRFSTPGPPVPVVEYYRKSLNRRDLIFWPGTQSHKSAGGVNLAFPRDPQCIFRTPPEYIFGAILASQELDSEEFMSLKNYYLLFFLLQVYVFSSGI